MHISNSSRAIVATAAIALLAGCGGGSTNSAVPGTTGGSQSAQSQVRTAQHPELLVSRPGVVAQITHGLPQMHTNKSGYKGTVVVSDAYNEAVYFCKSKGGCVANTAASWSEPQGIAVDHKGNVWVANTEDSTVVELSKTGALKATLQDPGEYPAGVAVSPDGKTVAVTNIVPTSGSGDANVVFYANGATSPTSTVSGLLARFYFGGFDNQNNLYVDGETASGVIKVGVIASGGTTVTDTGLGSVMAFPGGIEVTKKGDTLVVDDQSCPCARNYSLPGLTLTSTTDFSGASDPVSISLNAKDSQIFTADAGNAYAASYAYPAGGSTIVTITGFGQPIGVGNIKTGTE